MRVPVGIICSVIGASVLSYLAIVTLIAIPSEGPPRWFAVGGIAGLSLIVGVLVNGISMQDFRKVSRDHQETSNRYDSLTLRLSPLMYSGIEDVLHRRAESLKPDENLNFSVSVLTGGLVRNVASTFPMGHSTRSIERKMGEGLRGYFAEAKIAGFAQVSLQFNSANRPVFDRFGRQIDQIPVNPNAPSADTWNYIRPIFERSSSAPWSSRVVGALMVHSSADDADRLFKTGEFHDMVDSIAIEVSPYLDAIEVLVGEEKL